MLKKLTLLFLLINLISAQQQQLPDFKFQKIKDNFYLLQVFIDGNKLGANIGIYVGESELLVIDTHFAGLYPWLRNSFKQITDKKIKYTINTHWHPDHNSGNSFMGEEGIIIAQQNVLERLSSPQIGVGLGKPGARAEFPARPFSDLPKITFQESLDLLIDSSKVRLRHFPNAHTDGDCAVFFDDLKIVYLSDLYWPDEYPFADVYTGGNVIGIRNTLQDIVDETDDDYIFISGHQTTGSHTDLINYIAMIDKSVELVKSQWNTDSDYSSIKMDGVTQWSSDLVPDSVWVRMIINSL